MLGMRLSTLMNMLAGILVVLVSALSFGAEPPEDMRRILCFGDSNTRGNVKAPEQAWPAMLQGMLKRAQVINAGVGGRTVGQEKGLLNGLESLDAALKQAGRVDEVIVMLGTNDTKGYNWTAGGGAQGVAKRMTRLIDKLLLHHDEEGQPPKITIVAPPPVGVKLAPWGDKPEMFRGSDERVAALVPLYRELALRNRARFVDLHSAMREDFPKLADADGVHFTAEGQKRIAELVAQVLLDRESPAAVKDVKLEGQNLSWTASASPDVVGYEVYDGRTLLLTTVESRATLPEGHETMVVRARDGAGNISPPPTP